MTARLLSIFAAITLLCSATSHAANVIFIHPDGAGISHWQAARFFWVGPDANLNWDKLEEIAIYRGHLEDTLTASSNAGATIHAYGVKAPYAGFGVDKTGERLVAASGKKASLLHEAIAAGCRTGLINSGSVIEPGTAAFAASVKDRNKDSADVVAQMIESGTDVILSGGEEWFLPKETAGKFCGSGKREDGRNLIDEARKAGYQVVFTLSELQALPSDTSKVLGVFCEGHTFNDMTDEALAAVKLPTYKPGTPTLAEMTSEALRILSGRGKDIFLVIEEEGTDNFGNNTNALGTLDALKRADDAFGVALKFLEASPDTLIITAADSSAGGMDVLSSKVSGKSGDIMGQNRDKSGAEWDRMPDGKWFVAKPDRKGIMLSFIITWASDYDVSGGIVVKGIGKNADRIKGSFDNTDVYALMYETLFGVPLPAAPQ
ncbi:MAG: alkaline phosphatase [Chthoniobacterales bacterium]